jgi:hypothetical protein
MEIPFKQIKKGQSKGQKTMASGLSGDRATPD